MNQIQDWIVRYYASHDDIPAGHHDGEFLQALVRCRDCIYWDRMPSSTAFPQYHVCRRPFVQLSMEENGFCSWAVKKIDEVRE